MTTSSASPTGPRGDLKLPPPLQPPMLTPSVVKKGKTATECLKNQAELPIQCQHLLSSYSDCKRGMVSAAARGGICAELSGSVELVTDHVDWYWRRRIMVGLGGAVWRGRAGHDLHLADDETRRKRRCHTHVVCACGPLTFDVLLLALSLVCRHLVWSSTRVACPLSELLRFHGQATDAQLDMRRRFRGNHLSEEAKKGIPANAPKELSAE